MKKLSDTFNKIVILLAQEGIAFESLHASLKFNDAELPETTYGKAKKFQGYVMALREIAERSRRKSATVLIEIENLVDIFVQDLLALEKVDDDLKANIKSKSLN